VLFSRRFAQVGVLIIMTIALALSAQAATYSKASLKGSYSFLTNLWTAIPVPTRLPWWASLPSTARAM
jgi:hypothetical protein